ncbi:MAG: hypothetical protein K6A41_08170 [Bacteroidales bacterium]|nr:hypothetical protein [Bacteroidales bacterium]
MMWKKTEEESHKKLTVMNFVPIIIIIVLHIGITTYIYWYTNNIDEDNGTMLFALQHITCVLLLLFAPVIVSLVEEKDCYFKYGEVVKTSPLKPLDASCDSIYLVTSIDEYGGKTHYFRDSDSTLTKKGWQCEVCYHSDSIIPYYEFVSIVPKRWALWVFNPNHNRLQPRYFLHIQRDKNEKVVPPKDNFYTMTY